MICIKKKIIITALLVFVCFLVFVLVVKIKTYQKPSDMNSESIEQIQDNTFTEETLLDNSETIESQIESCDTQAKTALTTVHRPESAQRMNAINEAYDLAQEHGYNGSLREWIIDTTVKRQQDSGKSVYQLAVEQGFKGTHKEWVDQIIQSGQTEDTNSFITEISVTDNGHLVVTIDDATIETEDIFTPTESEQRSFTVTFFDVDGSVCKVQQVNKGKAATAPTIEKTGFLGWSGNYINVQQDETVTAVYADCKNVFHIASTQGKQGDTVSVLVRLDGNVELCGLDMILTYDPALELVSINDELDMDVVVNSNTQERIVRFNFSSAMNKKRTMDIMELTFRITGTDSDACGVQLSSNTIKTLVDNRVEDTDYTILNGVVYIHE